GDATLGIIAKRRRQTLFRAGGATGLLQDLVRFTAAHLAGFAAFEWELVGEQFLYRVRRLGYTVGSVARGIGENVVELVRDHATQGAAENGLAVLRIGPEKISLYKAANAVTIHVGEWQD